MTRLAYRGYVILAWYRQAAFCALWHEVGQEILTSFPSQLQICRSTDGRVWSSAALKRSQFNRVGILFQELHCCMFARRACADFICTNTDYIDHIPRNNDPICISCQLNQRPTGFDVVLTGPRHRFLAVWNPNPAQLRLFWYAIVLIAQLRAWTKRH